MENIALLLIWIIAKNKMFYHHHIIWLALQTLCEHSRVSRSETRLISLRGICWRRSSENVFGMTSEVWKKTFTFHAMFTPVFKSPMLMLIYVLMMVGSVSCEFMFTMNTPNVRIYAICMYAANRHVEKTSYELYIWNESRHMIIIAHFIA